MGALRFLFVILIFIAVVMVSIWNYGSGWLGSKKLDMQMHRPELSLRESVAGSISVSSGTIKENPLTEDDVHIEASRLGSESQGLMELSLLALFQTHDKTVASAVILAKGYGAYRYSIGEWVAGEYVINDIQPDHVVMEGNGIDFKLFLTPLSDGGQSPAQVAPPSVGRADGVAMLEQTRAQRERMRLLGMYDLYPVLEGAAAGYVIGERFPRETRERVGIEPGDIILSVNGFAVGEPVGDEQAFLSAQKAEEVSFVFQRQDGSILEYYYPNGSSDK